MKYFKPAYRFAFIVLLCIAAAYALMLPRKAFAQSTIADPVPMMGSGVQAAGTQALFGSMLGGEKLSEKESARRKADMDSFRACRKRLDSMPFGDARKRAREACYSEFDAKEAKWSRSPAAQKEYLRNRSLRECKQQVSLLPARDPRRNELRKACYDRYGAPTRK
jgi:hypothetical protein